MKSQTNKMTKQLNSDTRVWKTISLTLNFVGFYFLGASVYPEMTYNISNLLGDLPELDINYAAIIFSLVGGRIDIAKGFISQHITIVKSANGGTLPLKLIGLFLIILSIASTTSIGYTMLDNAARAKLNDNNKVLISQIKAATDERTALELSKVEVQQELKDERATIGSAFRNKRLRKINELNNSITVVNAKIAELENKELSIRNEFRVELFTVVGGVKVLAPQLLLFLIVGIFLEYSIYFYGASQTFVKLHNSSDSKNESVVVENTTKTTEINSEEISTKESSNDKALGCEIEAPKTAKLVATNKRTKAKAKRANRRINYEALASMVLANNDSELSYRMMQQKYALHPSQIQKLKKIILGKQNNDCGTVMKEVI